MGSGRGSWVNAFRPLRRARVYPDLLGLLQRVRAFFLRVSFVRGGIGVAAGRLLCSSHSLEREIRLHHTPRFLNPDYSVFDVGGVALSEDKLSSIWEGDRSGLGRVIGSSYLGISSRLPVIRSQSFPVRRILDRDGTRITWQTESNRG